MTIWPTNGVSMVLGPLAAGETNLVEMQAIARRADARDERVELAERVVANRVNAVRGPGAGAAEHERELLEALAARAFDDAIEHERLCRSLGGAEREACVDVRTEERRRHGRPLES